MRGGAWDARGRGSSGRDRVRRAASVVVGLVCAAGFTTVFVTLGFARPDSGTARYGGGPPPPGPPPPPPPPSPAPGPARRSPGPLRAPAVSRSPPP
ncbi:hypothetical protein OK074_8289, partial [Actinobacteria bacterium OK074]